MVIGYSRIFTSVGGGLSFAVITTQEGTAGTSVQNKNSKALHIVYKWETSSRSKNDMQSIHRVDGKPASDAIYVSPASDEYGDPQPFSSWHSYSISRQYWMSRMGWPFQ